MGQPGEMLRATSFLANNSLATRVPADQCRQRSRSSPRIRLKDLGRRSRGLNARTVCAGDKYALSGVSHRRARGIREAILETSGVAELRN